MLPHRENRDGPAIAPQLRILRQGPATAVDGGANLLVRMHLLRGLRGDEAAQCLPELRRRLRAPADQAIEGMAIGRVRGQASTLGQAREAEIFTGRRRRTLRAAEGCAAGTAVVLITTTVWWARFVLPTLHSRHCEPTGRANARPMTGS